MGKALNEIPFNKIYPGMKFSIKNGSEDYFGKVILTKDNRAKARRECYILIEWEHGAMSLYQHATMTHHYFVE